MSVRYRRTPGIEASPMQDESILFDPASNRFCLLNRTAAFLWERLETPATADELAAAVCEAFESPESMRVAQDVVRTLDRLTELQFVAAVPAA